MGACTLLVTTEDNENILGRIIDLFPGATSCASGKDELMVTITSHEEEVAIIRGKVQGIVSEPGKANVVWQR